jgi:bifunctional DNA-binding transcriptional regulator/antitoxin component of YhaV-PrlF toxin-antitoxin module
MVISMLMKKRMKISKGGQVSIPAPIRKRWETSTVTLDDQGDKIVIAPAPDDPIAAAAGALAEEFGHIDLAELRRIAREDDRIAIERREKREFP